MYDSFTGVINTYINEKQASVASYNNLLSVRTQCEKEIEIARSNAESSVAAAQISADAAVEQSYNNLLSVRAECEKEIELAKIELEKFQKKYEACMKVLNDAQSNFEQQLANLEQTVDRFWKEKENIWKMIEDDKKLKNIDTYFSQLNACNGFILELSKQIANLTPTYNALSEIK